MNVGGVGLSLKEIEPGKQFTVTLNFGLDFNLAPGQQAELTLKTSHPRFPTLKIPLRQYMQSLPAGATVRPLPLTTNINVKPVVR